MTDTKHTPSHTPGPWHYGIAYEPERGPQPLSYRGPGYYENAGILSANGETIVGCGEYEIFGPGNREERDANARLIAAAPELLAACQAALTAATEHVPLHELQIRAEEVRETLRAAIAKATGQ